jgi:Cof subfamily protein (haloacid dehalogenase superfamily)
MEKQVPHAPQIRALFLDIDGTLVGMEESVSPGVALALAAAQAQGCHVVLCTGRTRFRAQPVLESLGEPYGYLVASNGSVAAHAGRGEILYRHLMPIPLALEVVRAIVAVGSEPYVFEDSDRPGLEGARVLYHPEMTVGRWADIPRYRPYARILEELPFEPVSVSAFGPPERMRPLVEKLRTHLAGAVSVVQSGSEMNWGIEIYVPGVSKQVGVEYIAKHLGVRQDETMAVGDHLNDIEMLRWAGVGVAMGNALPEVRAAADYVTSGYREDGVARAVEHFVLHASSGRAPLAPEDAGGIKR